MANGWIVLTKLFWLPLASGEVINLALEKPVNVSSRFYNRDPRLAVDGNTDAVDPKVITTDTGHTSAWWSVDLQTTVQDPLVNIYFRTYYKLRRNGVHLYTSTTPFSTYPGGQLCHTVSGRVDGTDIPDVVSVNCSGSWRYLLVYTQTNNAGGGIILDFGEIEVLGCNRTYGENCDALCSVRQCAVTPALCDRYTGACPAGGCEDGWSGTDCTECQSGTYGENCTMSCSSRQCVVTSPNRTSCNRYTWACPDGCEAGWMGPDCTEECSSGLYGTNCIEHCFSRHCTESSANCDRISGECSGGCQPGWRREDCTQECQSGTYGPGCTLQCVDRKCTNVSSSCNHVTGQCVEGCQPGWNRTDCTQECPFGTYGDDCGYLCSSRHCLTSSHICDHVTGACPDDGCQPGWKGTTCEKGDW